MNKPLNASQVANIAKLVPLAGKGLCRYCDFDSTMDMRVFWNFTLDHLFPERLGGTDSPLNLVFCCYGCNNMKHGWDPSEGQGEPLTEESKSELIRLVRHYLAERRGAENYWPALFERVRAQKSN